MAKSIDFKEIVRMAELHSAGVSIYKIARMYGLSAMSIRNYLRNYSEVSDWYSYSDIIRKNAKKKKKEKQHYNTPEGAKAYQTFIELHRSLGYSYIEIWQKIKEIEEKHANE